MDIIERDITDAELRQVHAGFNQHAVEHGNPPEASQRFSIVAVDDGMFVGCSSGLACKTATGYGGWFYLTDMFVEKRHRGQGLGHTLLERLEHRVTELGISHIWAWTAGYEAPDFYRRHGYSVFFEQPNYYSSGHSRIGLYKHLDRSAT